MPRPKTNSVRLVVKVDAGIAEALRALVQRDSLNQSHFVQAAITRAIRNHRSPLEFINEGRERKDREPAAGALNVKTDRADGVPLACADMNSERDWRDTWRLSANCRAYLDEMRTSLSRPPLTDSEWKAIVRHMGSEPGSGKRKTITELTPTDDE